MAIREVYSCAESLTHHNICTHTHTAELQLKKLGAETAVAVIVLDKESFTNILGRQTGQREMRKTNIQGLKEYSGFKNLA